MKSIALFLVNYSTDVIQVAKRSEAVIMGWKHSIAKKFKPYIYKFKK